ncbi:MAG: ROK family protein [Armatimonadetes bacterium]|nr:ROK family protein [Armatimonadota bacterium]
MPTECVIGVDLGGTNVRAVAVDASGAMVGDRASLPSRAEEGAEATLQAVAQAVDQARAGLSPVSVGLAIPGRCNDREGVVHWSPNFGVRVDGALDCWKDVDVRGPLFDALGLPITMANDANAAAVGEYRFGSGKGSANCLVMLTIGTGIGGGVVLGPASVGGKVEGPLLLLGGNKGGAELGHTVIEADWETREALTVEKLCQRDAIVRRAEAQLEGWRLAGGGTRPLITELIDQGKLTPKDVTEAADKGDELAVQVWRETGRYLGTAIGSLISVFAPDVFAIGGQIAKAGKWLMDPAIEQAEKIAIPSLFADCKITQAEQIDDAGLLGAAAVAWEAQK